MKGEVYTAPPNMKAITMKEHWRWGNDGTMFLDVSCLIFNREMEHVGTVDFSSR